MTDSVPATMTEQPRVNISLPGPLYARLAAHCSPTPTRPKIKLVNAVAEAVNDWLLKEAGTEATNNCSPK